MIVCYKWKATSTSRIDSWKGSPSFMNNFLWFWNHSHVKAFFYSYLNGFQPLNFLGLTPRISRFNSSLIFTTRLPTSKSWLLVVLGVHIELLVLHCVLFLIVLSYICSLPYVVAPWSLPCVVVIHYRPSIHLIHPCVITIHSLPCIVNPHLTLLVLAYWGYVLPLLPCVGFKAWSSRCHL
jgi:hypothetical protein